MGTVRRHARVSAKQYNGHIRPENRPQGEWSISKIDGMETPKVHRPSSSYCSGSHRPQSTRCYADYIAQDWKTGGAATLKYATQKHYCHILDAHLVPALGKARLCDIKREWIQSFLATKLNTGLAWKTVKPHSRRFGTDLVDRRGLGVCYSESSSQDQTSAASDQTASENDADTSSNHAFEGSVEGACSFDRNAIGSHRTPN